MDTVAVKNQDGVDVLPLAAYNPVEPKQGVIFDDELYAKLSESTPVQVNPAEQTPQANAGPEDPVVPLAAPTEPNVVADTGQPITTQQPEAAVVTPPDEVQVVDIDALVKERSGGKFERLDDLLKLSDKPATAEVQFANEQSKLVYEYLKEGKIQEVTDFLAQQQYLSNVDNMSPNELLQLKIQMTMTDLTPDEKQEEYNDSIEAYGLNIDREDYLTDEDYQKAIKKGMRKLKADLMPFVADVKAFRQELTLPNLAPPANNVSTKQSVLNELVQALTNDSTAHTPSLGEIKLSSIVDKDAKIDYSFAPDEVQKSELQTVLKDYESDFKQRYSKDGTAFDYTALQRDIFIRNNFEKIVAAAMKDAYMKGKLGQAMTLANATSQHAIPGTGIPSDVAAQSYHKSLADFLAAT